MNLIAYCRPGFEAEGAQELQHWMTQHGATGYARAARDSAFVRYTLHDAEGGDSLSELPTYRDTIFARQLLREIGELPTLDARDRLKPIAEMLRDLNVQAHDLWVETPDSAVGAELVALCRGFEAAALSVLRKKGVIVAGAPLRLHITFLTGTHAVLSLAVPDESSPWRMGIPRLRLPREAPSRSALKIEEAWLTLLDEQERETWLQPGMSAVDLGASPGGWTWQLAKKSIRVKAIDNGPMNEVVFAQGIVEHVRADGFRYRPATGRVDWVVCDMVEQPSRVAALMAEWLAQGHARAALFNLKLPMKKRWQEVVSCLDVLHDALPDNVRGKAWRIRAKQLYHDREEITVVALPPLGQREASHRD